MLDIRENVPLAPLTTIGIGGPARFYVKATTREEVVAAVEWASSHTQPLFILGGGSNLLIADRGFDGLVVHIDLRGIESRDDDGHVLVAAAAGEPWDPFVAFCVGERLAGIECLSGIPGLLGATPIQNVGAYGQEVSETIAGVELYDRADRRLLTFGNRDCAFGYRDSLFKREGRDRYVVLGVTYRLIRGGAPSVRYPDLKKFLDKKGVEQPALSDVREAVIAVRRSKGMVLDPADPDTRSDGSFFMNPILSREDAAAFQLRARQRVGDEKVPAFPSADGSVKLSAAWLIEHAGFHKGFVHGRAGLSTKHTLAVINRGGAGADEVAELVAMIQRRVKETFGVALLPEPNFVGFSEA